MSKYLLLLTLVGLSAHAQVNRPNELKCLEDLSSSIVGVSDKKACLEKAFKMNSETEDPKIKDDIEKKFLFVSTGIYGEELSLHLKELIKNDRTQQDEELADVNENINDLLSGLNSSDRDIVKKSAFALITDHVQEQKVVETLKEILQKNPNDVRFQIVLSTISDLVLSTCEEKVPENKEQCLKENRALEPKFSIKPLMLDVLEKKSNPQNARLIAVQYLSQLYPSEIRNIAIAGIGSDPFYKSVLIKFSDEPSIRALTQVFTDAPEDNFELIAPILKSEIKAQHQLIFNVAIDPESTDRTSKEIFFNIFESRMEAFGSQIFQVLTLPTTKISIRNFLLTKISLSKTLKDLLFKKLYENSLDINLSKDIVCYFSNAQSSELLPLVQELITAPSISEALKRHSLQCLSDLMDERIVPQVKQTYKNANNIETKFLSLVLLSPYIPSEDFSRMTLEILPELDDESVLKIFPGISDFNKSSTRALVLTILKSRQDTATISSILNLLAHNVVSTSKMLQEFILKQPQLSAPILQALFELEEESLIYISELLAVEKFAMLSPNSRQKIIIYCSKYGNDQTLNLIKSDYKFFSEQIEPTQLNSSILKLEKRVANSNNQKQVLENQINQFEESGLNITEVFGLIQRVNKNLDLPSLTKITAAQKVLHFLSSDYTQIDKISLLTFYEAHEILNSLAHQALSTKDLNEILSKNELIKSYFIQQLVKVGLISRSHIENQMAEIQQARLSDSMELLTGYIHLKNIVTKSNADIFQDMISIDNADSLRTKLHKDLKQVIGLIAPHHTRLSSMTTAELEEMIDGKNISPNSHIMANSSGENLPVHEIFYDNNWDLSPGIYKCPTNANCSIRVQGTMKMDPFSLIVGTSQENPKSWYTPSIMLRASSFEDIFVDLSAVQIKPATPKDGDLGAPNKWGREYSHMARVCVRRTVFKMCRRYEMQPRFRKVIVEKMRSGGNGTKGTSGNNGGNLTIDFIHSQEVSTSIKGTISLISLGATGGNGSNGGKANGGPSDGLIGAGGDGGNGGHLKSILFENKQLADKFNVIAIGGVPGLNGTGSGAIPEVHSGQNGKVKKW